MRRDSTVMIGLIVFALGMSGLHAHAEQPPENYQETVGRDADAEQSDEVLFEDLVDRSSTDSDPIIIEESDRTILLQSESDYRIERFTLINGNKVLRIRPN